MRCAHADKEAVRNNIEKDIAEFAAKGHSVVKLESGHTGLGGNIDKNVLYLLRETSGLKDTRHGYGLKTV